MRILYNNLLEDSTLAATNEDANYPVENVYDTTLLSEFRADTNSSVITVTLAAEASISCFAFGNHNIDTLQIKLISGAAATLATYNYTASDLKWSDAVTRAMQYETAVTGVASIEYTVTSVSTLYIGGLAAGSCLQMPHFSVAPKIGRKSSGKAQKSRGGVTYNVPGVTLETFSCTFNSNDLDDKNAQDAWFDAVQVYVPHWIDRWEGSSEVPVMFAQNTKDVSHIKALGLTYDSYRIDLEECK